MATAEHDGVATALRAGARRALHPLGDGCAGARARGAFSLAYSSYDHDDLQGFFDLATPKLKLTDYLGRR